MAGQELMQAQAHGQRLPQHRVANPAAALDARHEADDDDVAGARHRQVQEDPAADAGIAQVVQETAQA
ncbi:hypothetical protein D3C85_1793730 [compost metagenome]